MEEKVRIQDDLYNYVNGEWLKTAVIPADRPNTGGFVRLDMETEKLMMADLRDFAQGKKTCELKEMEPAVALYRKVLDTKRRNEEGIAPLKPLLGQIKDLKDTDELNIMARELLYKGARMPFNCGVEADMKDATKNSFYVLGPDIILPDTPYYDTDEGKHFLEIFKDMAKKALSFTDLSEQEQQEYLEDTLTFDRLIAGKVKSQLEWSDYVKNYNPMSLEEVCGYMRPFDLKGLLKSLYGEEIPDTIIVYDPKAIREMSAYFNEENFTLYRHWSYVWTLLSKAVLLSEELYKTANTYRRALLGIAEDPVLEKQAYKVVSSYFDEPLGIYYGRTYFGEEAKKDITSIVEQVIATYIIRMRENAFIGEETSEKAIRKLKAIAIKMGYPDEAREIYRKLKVEEEDSYYRSIEKLNEVFYDDEFHKLHKKVDRSKWNMPGHMVNASYDPSRNDITFPAAILQKPFYSLEQSVSENLGGIDAVIGHEISHAFDNNGARFDENGNLSDWWSKEDFEAFDRLTQDMIEQWDGIEFHGSHVNGELVVSENIADNGGIAVTLDIMHHTEGADFQKYFMNWARVWCMKAKEEYIQLLLKNDTHSPSELRANIQVRNFDEWYEAFGVTENDRMYIAPQKRIVIW